MLEELRDTRISFRREELDGNELLLTLSLDQLNETSIHGRHAAALTAVGVREEQSVRPLRVRVVAPTVLRHDLHLREASIG